MSPCRAQYRQDIFLFEWKNQEETISAFVALLTDRLDVEILCFILLLSFQTQIYVDVLWSICPQGVKLHVYAHAYVYVSCLPNLPNVNFLRPRQKNDCASPMWKPLSCLDMNWRWSSSENCGFNTYSCPSHAHHACYLTGCCHNNNSLLVQKSLHKCENAACPLSHIPRPIVCCLRLLSPRRVQTCARFTARGVCVRLFMKVWMCLWNQEIFWLPLIWKTVFMICNCGYTNSSSYVFSGETPSFSGASCHLGWSQHHIYTPGLWGKWFIFLVARRRLVLSVVSVCDVWPGATPPLLGNLLGGPDLTSKNFQFC